MEGENKPIKNTSEEGNKYSLQNGPIKDNQVEFIFSRTPEQHVHKRPGKGGGEWEYVTGTYVKKVLNYLFAWLWDFEVITQGNVEVKGKIVQVWVQGKLTIKRDTKNGIETVMTKTQYGGADVKYLKNSQMPLDYANDLKAATTDALKKCASELGIASDIYGKEEFREIENQQTNTEKTQPEKQQTDFLPKIKQILSKQKKEGETDVQAYNRLSGQNIKSFNIKQTTAQKYYYTLVDKITN